MYDLFAKCKVIFVFIFADKKNAAQIGY